MTAHTILVTKNIQKNTLNAAITTSDIRFGVGVCTFFFITNVLSVVNTIVLALYITNVYCQVKNKKPPKGLNLNKRISLSNRRDSIFHFILLI